MNYDQHNNRPTTKHASSSTSRAKTEHVKDESPPFLIHLLQYPPQATKPDHHPSWMVFAGRMLLQSVGMP
jgi:hypothetical protein